MIANKELAEVFGQGSTNLVELFIPSTYVESVADTAMGDAMAQAAIRLFCAWFEGATIFTAQGAYTLDNGQVVRENVTVVQSNASDKQLSRDILLQLAYLAHFIRTTMSQESVAVRINGVLHFVSAPKS